MPVTSDDDVIMHCNAERLGRFDNCTRHLNVGARRRRVAGRMIVNKDDRRRRQFQRPLDHFARVDRRVIHRPGLLNFVAMSAFFLSRNRMRNCSRVSKPMLALQ
jgi:hypothetical protein